jgi:hypothetical protein
MILFFTSFTLSFVTVAIFPLLKVLGPVTDTTRSVRHVFDASFA